jgi:hypothetical protein
MNREKAVVRMGCAGGVWLCVVAARASYAFVACLVGISKVLNLKSRNGRTSAPQYV